MENITMRFDTENKYFTAIHGDVPQVGEFSIRRGTKHPLADFKTVEKCPIELYTNHRAVRTTGNTT